MTLPAAYRWLTELAGLPKIITEALALFGTTEKAGTANNPVIMGWASETGIHYPGDSVPWCGLFAAVVVQRAGKRYPPGPLWARGWTQFGTRKDVTPSLGDVLVFTRGKGGHVGFYVGEDATHYHVLGGNQGDSVSIVRIAKDRLLGARRPEWKVAQPEAVKPYLIDATGVPVSTNEA